MFYGEKKGFDAKVTTNMQPSMKAANFTNLILQDVNISFVARCNTRKHYFQYWIKGLFLHNLQYKIWLFNLLFSIHQ